MMKTLARLFSSLASLRLTIFCLAAALVLVFAGTLAQKELDTFFVQTHYFQSWVVWWQASPEGFRFPMFPGGHLVGAVLLANLLASFFSRFKWTWRKFGIHLIHIGLIIMLTGGLLTDLFSVSSFMSLREGESKNYSEDAQRVELAVVDQSNPSAETVFAIPGELVAKGGVIRHERLPFSIHVRSYYRNSRVNFLGPDSQAASRAADKDFGALVSIHSQPEITRRSNQVNVRGAVVEIIPNDAPSLGTWLVSEAAYDMKARMSELGRWLTPSESSNSTLVLGPQSFTLKDKTGEKTWSLQLRPVRYYKSYSLTLVDFSHKLYPGSGIPKDFSSHVTLKDPAAGEDRSARIYMNHPLRHDGDTYYQSSTFKDDMGAIMDNATILQVVRNPSYQTPYIACAVISVGLIWQFLFHLVRFIAKRASQQPSKS